MNETNIERKRKAAFFNIINSYESQKEVNETFKQVIRDEPKDSKVASLKFHSEYFIRDMK